MLFFQKNFPEHNFKFADKDTEAKKKNDTKKAPNTFKISSPEFKKTFFDSFFEDTDCIKESKANAEQLYETHLSKEMVQKYGPSFAQSFEKKVVELPPSHFFQRHKIKSSMRAQLVNWMLEVFHVFESDENTFFAAVRILDKFIWKSNDLLTEETLFQACIACISIASKLYDYDNIRMKDLVHKVTHGEMSEKLIQKYEKIILTAIDFDIVTPGPSEFIQFLLYDLYMNNKEVILKCKLRKIIDIVENCAIWVAKMCNHYEKYSSVPPNYIAVACLLIGYEMTKDNRTLSSNEKKFFVDYFEFLFEKIGKQQPSVKNHIDLVYQNIYKSFIKFRQSGFKNLSKYHELFFE